MNGMIHEKRRNMAIIAHSFDEITDVYKSYILSHVYLKTEYATAEFLSNRIIEILS